MRLVALACTIGLVAALLLFGRVNGNGYGMPGFDVPYTGCYHEDSQQNASTDGVLDAGQSMVSYARVCTGDEYPSGAGGVGLKWVLRNAPPNVVLYAIQPDGTIQHPWSAGVGRYGTEWRSCAVAEASIASGNSGQVPLVNPIQSGVWTFVVVNHGAAMKLDGNYRNDLWFGLWVAMSYAPFQNQYDPTCPTQDQRLTP